MPKLDIKKIKKYGIMIFGTKKEMLEYIAKSNFKDSLNDKELVIKYRYRKWIVRWE